jgi:thiamine biosynthesis lipoprotein
MSAMAEIEIPLEPEVDLSFEAMGTWVRVLVGARTRAELPPPGEAAAFVRKLIHRFDATLSRFRPDSELSRLNGSPQRSFRASPLLRRLVAAGVDAAELSGGLVDPTLLGAIERAGYRSSRSRAAEPLLEEALAVAPPRRPAGPDPRARWRGFEVSERDRSVRRRPGLRFDSGGIGKGLAADLAFEQLRGYERFLVDCGGDIRVGGPGAALDPYEVLVAHPLDGSLHRRARVASGAVATSGLDGRIWRQGEGYSHHLLDPSTGRPAWTGVISATALGPSAVVAETLAKTALLSGAAGARGVLAAHGGLFVTDDGRHEVVRTGTAPVPGAARPRPFPRRARAAA